MKLSDILILPAYDIETQVLTDFYDAFYPGRLNKENWKWLNRTLFCDNKAPLVIFYKNRVIGHAGAIPFRVLLDGDWHLASWFIDFGILPEFRGKGLSSMFVEKWMELFEIHLALGCNEKSAEVFKKNGWIESSDTYLHSYILLPFNRRRLMKILPVFIRKGLNSASRYLVNSHYVRYASPVDYLRFEDININSIEKFKVSLKAYHNSVISVRDFDYISWRLLESPDKKLYRICTIDGMSEAAMIIKIQDKGYSPHLDLLWLTGSTDYSAIRRIIASLAVWGMRNNYTHLRCYTSGRRLSEYLKRYLRPVIARPRFLFCAKDQRLLSKLKTAKWNWELMDNDFEWW